MKSIAIIGAGVSGLSCGIRLRETGFDTTILAARRSPNTTSNRAGAVFTPFRAGDDRRVRGWTQSSYADFCDIATRNNPETGITVGPLWELFHTPQPTAPWWADLVADARRLAAVPAGYVDAFAASMPRMDMTRYMPWLERRFAALGGRIIERSVRSFDDLSRDEFGLIVNCAGLGARELCRDPAMTPLRGQILHVPRIATIDTALCEEGRGQTVTYVFPFRDYMVLGGTYEPGEETETTDPAALAAIVVRCNDMLERCGFGRFADLAGAPLRTLAGLRPARRVGSDFESVRLEMELLGDGRNVIHNYGHGRTGVSLSWGCAAEVTELALGAR